LEDFFDLLFFLGLEEPIVAGNLHHLVDRLFTNNFLQNLNIIFVDDANQGLAIALDDKTLGRKGDLFNQSGEVFARVGGGNWLWSKHFFSTLPGSK